MQSCDVLIVGGGPAGSSLAWKLRNTGLDVLIIDKSDFPREKVCAGWVTPAVFAALGIDPDEYGRGRVLQPITAFRTAVMGCDGILTEYGNPVSYGIRRSEFDQYLLHRSGARLRLGEPLRRLARWDRHWIANDIIKTPLVIGAGGHFCPVSRLLNPDNDEKGWTVVAKEIEFEMDEDQLNGCMVEAETPELYFCEDLKGYGWCFRKGNFLNIGLGRMDSSGVSRQVESFKSFLEREERVSTVPAEFRGHAYRLYQPGLRRMVDDGVILVGDAAGLAYPQSGEGIRPAVESGLKAAEVIIEAAGSYSKDSLMPYQQMLASRFGSRKSMNPLHMLSEVVKSRIAVRLMASEWFTRRILLGRWFLHSHQAPLI